VADHKLFDVVNVTVDTAFRYMYFTKQPMVATYCYLARMMTFSMRRLDGGTTRATSLRATDCLLGRRYLRYTHD